jgi:hypothetical protein
MTHGGDMGIRVASALITGCLCCAFARAEDGVPVEIASSAAVTMTAEDAENVGVGTASVPGGYVNKKDPWIDRAHQGVFNAVWRSAMHMDHMFGGGSDDTVYMDSTGSLAPALLYDDFDGFQPRLRFQVDVPLPRINERFHAFIGRVNPDEYVTERKPGSGAFARQYGGVADEDETLFGIRYRDPKDGGHWDADAGLRIRSPLDPFVKGSYRFDKGSSERTLLSFRETAFWQNTEKFGFTSRVDVERILREVWLLRWTTSATISQRSDGVKGYMSLVTMRGLPNRRAVAAELFSEGEMDADVPLGNYGLKLAYRRSISRDWLVLETRVSLTWPKDLPTQERQATWGVGVGLEMFFGTGDFLARPVTF